MLFLMLLLREVDRSRAHLILVATYMLIPRGIGDHSRRKSQTIIFAQGRAGCR